MRQPLFDPAQVLEYHAHVYYSPETRAAADALRQELGTRFTVRLGRWHDASVGPHTRSMYQVAFAPAVFADLVPWLMLNRGPLDLLIHPETGDDLADHRDHAMWLGQKLPLRLEVFAKTRLNKRGQKRLRLARGPLSIDRSRSRGWPALRQWLLGGRAGGSFGCKCQD